MKTKSFLGATLLSIAVLVSCGAQATNLEPILNPLDHATRGEVKAADKKLQDQITAQVKSGVSVNADLQASKATQASINTNVQGQIHQVGSKVKELEQKGVSAYNEVNGKIGKVNDKVDSLAQQGQAAYGQIQGQISQTNQAVADVDSKVNGVNGKLDSAIESQNNINQQQHQTNQAIQGAAQTANDRATNLEVRADKGEASIRETNAQLAVTDSRSINNAVRLESVETNVGKNTADIATVNNNLNSAVSTQNTINNNQANTNVKVQSQVTNLDNRTTATENVNVRQDTQINNLNTKFDTTYREYGARMDKFDNRLGKVEDKVDRADETALIGLAVAGHQFNTDLDAGFQVALSGSTNGSKQGVALGAGGALTKNLFMNIGVGSSGSTTAGVVSATYSFGR